MRHPAIRNLVCGREWSEYYGRPGIVTGMRLLAVPDASGKPSFWINADHLVSVHRVERRIEHGSTLEAELKVDGMPLQRVLLGDFNDIAALDQAWGQFLTTLQQ